MEKDNENIKPQTKKVIQKKVSNKKTKDKKIIKKQMKINTPQNKINFKELLKYKKVIIVGIIILVILIAIVIGIINLINRTKYDPYYKYEQKMIDYGYDQLYTNKTKNTQDPITRIEAVKMAVVAALNTTDISTYMHEDLKLYEDSLWGEYAEKMGILGKFNINSENFNDEIDYITAITYFKNAKDILLPEKVDKDYDKKISDLDKYSLNEQRAIKDLLGYGIIKEFDGSINGKDKVFKGQINELVVNFVWNLNTITLSQEDKLNINPDNIPSNVKDYPYTLASVDKSVYEIPFKVNIQHSKYTPVELFSEKNNNIKQAVTFAEEFFDYYLNIDYKTINVDDFKESMDSYQVFSERRESIEDYVNYVKANEIILKGSGTAIMPVFYFDGTNYKMRINIKFEVVKSKTKDNLLYLDTGGGYNKKYKDNTYDFYVDYNMNESIDSDYIYVSASEMYNNILNTENVNIEITKK